MNKYSGLEIVYELLLELELGTNPEENKPWPAFIGTLPDVKPQAISLFDMSIPTEGRIQSTGETIGHEGIQVRVTAKNYRTAREKVFELKEAFDSIIKYTVPVENEQYEIQAIHLMRQPAYIGQDENDRDHFTLDIKTISRKVD
jgi:hypothetical protein